jgi:hypothetical protein
MDNVQKHNICIKVSFISFRWLFNNEIVRAYKRMGWMIDKLKRIWKIAALIE